MISILGFLIILAPLVIVHELGHFFFARLFGVRADIFSVGFGPKIWRRKIGETEYCLSAIPLGGYVKLFGEEPGMNLPEEEKKRSLQYQKAWKRFFIYFGGPLFNFLWAILVFMVILFIGEPQPKSVIGRVIPETQAERVGFKSGDHVLQINQNPVERFSDVNRWIQEHPGQQLKFALSRLNQPAEVTATPLEEEGFSAYGEPTMVGKIDGIFMNARAAFVGISNPSSLAAKSGLKTGDQIKALNGIQVQDWEAFEREYAALSPQVREAKIELKDGRNVSIPLPSKKTNPANDLGLASSELFIKEVVPSSPAYAAGLKPGDRIIAVSGTPVSSFFGMKENIQAAGEHSGVVEVRWEREGKTLDAKILPMKSTERDPMLKKKVQFTIGVIPMLEFSEGENVIDRETNPFALVWKASGRMFELCYKNLMVIGKMFKGDVSVGTLGGPILIGKIAGDSISRGLIAFLTTMAVLSVGLGILNVLPVPVLDGGHLLMLGVEVVRGRPLSVRQIEIAQQVGLSLILLLMAVVMRNDLSRLSIFN